MSTATQEALSVTIPALVQGGALPLRDYQARCLDEVAAAAERGVRRQLVVLPTGAGKTVTFAHMVTRNGGRALVLAHRDELLNQAADKLRQVAPGLDVGIIKAARDERSAQVVIGSVQSLRGKRLESLEPVFDVIVVDEAHHATATTYRDILEHLGAFKDDGPLTVGFTATAGRADGVGLGHVWQEIVFQRGILQMIAEGYLVDVKALAVTSDMDFGNVRSRGGDFTEASLGAELERSHAIPAAAVAYKRYAADRRGIAFTPTVATAHALAEELGTQGIRAEAVDGTTPVDLRRAILKRLHTGETQVVANCGVLTEGYDEPAVSCALMARPTKSETLFVQMAGRPLRPFPGKSDALILDVVGASTVGLATIADLAGLPPDAVRKNETLLDAAERLVGEPAPPAVVRALRAEQVSLFRRSGLQWLPAADGWVLETSGSARVLLVPTGDDQWEVWKEQRDAPAVRESKDLTLEWARGVGEEHARASGGVLAQSGAKWREKPPSDRQMTWLRKNGYAARLGDKPTRGAASDAMTTHFAARTINTLKGDR